MTLVTLNAINYVLFPNPANWRTLPKWQRAWQTEINQSLAGQESRHGLRAQPRVSLTWLITPWSIQEQQELDDAIRAAKLSGYACAPFWGRASVLASDLTNSTEAVVLTNTAWDWQGNDVVFLDNAPGTILPPTFDIKEVATVAGVDLTLSKSVGQTYPAGALIWPLIYGMFTCKDMAAETGKRGAVQVTIKELVSSFTEEVTGATYDPPTVGIGAWQVDNTFSATA